MIPAALPILFEAVLRALVAACALGAVLWMLRVKNIPAQKAAWGLVLVAALAMPMLMRWQWLPAWAAVKVPALTWMRGANAAPTAAAAPAIPVALLREPAATAPPVSEPQDYVAWDAGVPTEFPAPHSVAAAPMAAAPAAPLIATRAGKPTAKSVLARVLAFGWPLYLGVVAALLLRLMFGFFSSLRLWLEAKPVAGAEATKIPGGMRVRSSRSVASPVNIGSGILLPADFASWDEEKLCVVLAHEQAHVEQRDYYLQLLAGFYAAVTWFSPLGWWLKRKLSELGEAISDRAGLEAAASPSAYAELLLEFAAMPRPTVSGVAMANSTNLPERIERLLNETSFRQTFAGGRRALVTLLVPAVLIAATAMVRVQAAAKPMQTDSTQAAKLPAAEAPQQNAAVGQSNPAAAEVSERAAMQAPQAAPTPEAAPAPAAAPSNSAAPAPVPAPAAPGQEPTPPMPPTAPESPRGHVHVEVHVPPMPRMPRVDAFEDGGYSYRKGDEAPYAIVGDAGTKSRFYGDWNIDREAEVEKARKIAHGHFILFRREGKTYIVDDPELVKQAEDMDHAIELQSEQMRAMGKQMRDQGEQLREQMRAATEQAREAARKDREAAANIPVPDLSKEMAALEATVASLKDKQGSTISREQLQEIQRDISAIQRRVIEAEVKVNVHLDFDTPAFKAAQSQFSEKQSEFGAQMGQMGEKMGQVIRENNDKIKSMMDESMKDGKARPVE